MPVGRSLTNYDQHRNMGDDADYVLSSLEMSDEYWGNVMYEEESDSFLGPGIKRSKTCRCCGQPGLHWEMLSGKWRLFSSDGVHNCPQNPLNNL